MKFPELCRIHIVVSKSWMREGVTMAVPMYAIWCQRFPQLPDIEHFPVAFLLLNGLSNIPKAIKSAADCKLSETREILKESPDSFEQINHTIISPLVPAFQAAFVRLVPVVVRPIVVDMAEFWNSNTTLAGLFDTRETDCG